MAESCVAAETSMISDDSHVLQVQSNKISSVLAQLSPRDLANTKHVRLTSTPGDDLAEEDFLDRVRSLLEPMTGLVSLTICIPSMARLHPSNSLPKVLDVLHSASVLRPQCRLGLAVHEAEQAWNALTVLNRIVELRLALDTIDFSRAFFPVDVLIQTAQACGLVSLTLDGTQVFNSSSSSDTVNHARTGRPSIPTLTSLTAQAHAEAEASVGLDFLLYTAASTLTHLDLSSSPGVTELTLRGREFPRLKRLDLHEHLLSEILHARMPELRYLAIPALTRTENVATIEAMLQRSGSQLKDVRVSRVVAGDLTEALSRLEEKNPSVRVTIEELAIREPARLTPAVLLISENLVNAGPPIAEDWPLGFGEHSYPRVKSIVLKVHEDCNHDAFIASLNAPNLKSPPTISVIRKKKGKAR